MSQLIFEQKRTTRNTAIDGLIAKATAQGDCTDRLYWTLIYDFEHAPMTTNLAQLAEVGIQPLAPDQTTDAELFTQLWLVINGLARLGIYITNSNHLTDRAFYERLISGILVEPVRDLPPDAGVQEFIDLLGGVTDPSAAPPVAVTDRDSCLPRPQPQPTTGGTHES